MGLLRECANPADSFFGRIPEPPAIARPASAAVLRRTTPPSSARPVPIEAPEVERDFFSTLLIKEV